MQIHPVHDWRFRSPAEAIRLQQELAGRVLTEGVLSSPRYIAGVDVSINRYSSTATAAAVVLEYPALNLVESVSVTGEAVFPYIPGLLSFREVPIILAACEKLSVTPDLFMVDGQGIAHPRRIGLASHLGLFLGVPAIGCAKSPLFGRFEEPGDAPGNYSDIVTNSGEVIGVALRTKKGSKPLIVSIGHRIDLPTAVKWVLECCRGYRLPEPTRLAHLASRGSLPEPGVKIKKSSQQHSVS